MTQGIYDVVAMGAGHNGLVAAAYLAKAGKKVLVLERKPYPGGGVTTRQLNTPGYWHDEHSSVHIMIQGNPMLRQDELGLIARHGLKYHYSPVPHATIFPDQSVLYTYMDIDKTCESFARISPKDAETYRNFVRTSQQILKVFLPGLYSPPPPLGELVAMLDRSEEGRLMLDYMNRDCLDLVNQLYESDKIKIHLLRLVSENLQAPNDLGTGMGVLVMPGIIHTYGVSQPVGGSGKLTEALVRCLESHGGEVRCNAEVDKILTNGGRATGVRLTGGEEITARDAVIGAIHPHVIRKFVDGVAAPVLQRAERATLAPFSIMATHFDLKGNVRYHAGDEVGYATMLEFMATDRLDEMVADFDDLRRGLITGRRLCAGGDESIGDKTRVPPGAGMFHMHHLCALHRQGPALGGPRLGRHQGRDRRSLGGPLPEIHCQPDGRQHHCAHGREPAGHGALQPEQHDARRLARRGAVLLSKRRPPPDTRPRPVHGARRRQAVPGRAVPAPGWRRVRGRPRDGDEDVRATRHGFQRRGRRSAPGHRCARHQRRQSEEGWPGAARGGRRGVDARRVSGPGRR